MTAPSGAQQQYSAEEIERAHRGSAWWSMAENPPCQPWCEKDHDDHEFRVSGDFMCDRDFGLTVHVVWLVTGSYEVPFGVDVVGADVLIYGATDQLVTDGASARHLAYALRAAADFYDQITQEHTP